MYLYDRIPMLVHEKIYLESIRDLLDPNGTLTTAGAGSKLSPRSGSCINGGSFNSVPPVAEGRCRSPCRSQIPMNIRENKVRGWKPGNRHVWGKGHAGGNIVTWSDLDFI